VEALTCPKGTAIGYARLGAHRLRDTSSVSTTGTCPSRACTSTFPSRDFASPISGSLATGVVTGEVEDADERRIPGGERGRAVGDHERVTR